MSTPQGTPQRLLQRSNTGTGLIRPVSLPPPPALDPKAPLSPKTLPKTEPPLSSRTDTPTKERDGAPRLGESRGIRIGGSGRNLNPQEPVATDRPRANSHTIIKPPDLSPRSALPRSGLRSSEVCSMVGLVGRLWPEGTLWCNIVDKEFLSSLSAQERKRQEVIFELISTERRYVEDVAMILNVFSQPLQALLKPPEHAMLFINMKDLLPVNQGFLKDLEDVQREGNMLVEGVGSIILKWCNQFKLYAAYCANSQNTKKNVDEMRQKNDKFAMYLENQITRPECRGLNLEALLIKPVQRICKYPLLLKDLLKATPDEDADHEPIAESFKSLQLLVDKINERTRRVDNAKKIEEIQKTLEKNKDLDLQSDLNRLFIREGAARLTANRKEKDGKDVHLFLFSDLLLVTKKSKDKYQVLKHMPAIGLKAVDVPEWLTGISDTLELQYSAGEGPETLQFDSKDLKLSWLADLTKAIEGSLEKQQEQAKLEASLQMARLEKQKAASEPKMEIADSWKRTDPVSSPEMGALMMQVRDLIEENKKLRLQVDQLQKDLQDERTKRLHQEEICQRWHS